MFVSAFLLKDTLAYYNLRKSMPLYQFLFSSTWKDNVHMFLLDVLFLTHYNLTNPNIFLITSPLSEIHFSLVHNTIHTFSLIFLYFLLHYELLCHFGTWLDKIRITRQFSPLLIPLWPIGECVWSLFDSKTVTVFSLAIYFLGSSE